MFETSRNAAKKWREDGLPHTDGGLGIRQEGCSARGEEKRRHTEIDLRLCKHMLQTHACTHTRSHQIPAFMWNVLG